MKTKPRWMKSVIEAAKAQEGHLPFGRKLDSFEDPVKHPAQAKA